MSDNDKTKAQTINITSHNQTGGVTAHTVNFEKQPRHLNEAQLQELLQGFQALGATAFRLEWPATDGEAYQCAMQIRTFLISSGVTESGSFQSIGGTPFLAGIAIYTDQRPPLIRVGPQQ